MNYDQILDKPFLVTTIPWTTAYTPFSELWRLPFPSSIMSNALARVPFNSSVFYQAKMCCMLQVSGTPMHQGILLVAALPHGTPKILNPNQILSAPHVFLNATESTSVCLECPMYTPTTVYRTANPLSNPNNTQLNTSVLGPDVFDLVLFIMDPLLAAAGSSTSISVSVHCMFEDAEFYVPKVGEMQWQAQCGMQDHFVIKSKAEIGTNCACGNKKVKETEGEFENEASVKSRLLSMWSLPTTILDDVATGLKGVAGDIIDYTRNMVRGLTGFHNPNNSQIESRMMATFRNFPNNVDQVVRYEVLDNHSQFSRIYDDFYFRTSQDEMDLPFLLSKPVYIGKFKVSGSDAIGKNLFAYPMTPMVEAGISGLNAETIFYSPMRTIYEASRYWRGSLKLHIQANCTNFHFCKLIILKSYTSVKGVVSSSSVVPSYNSIHNLPTDTLEFSAGGQVHTIDLPFCSNLKQLECTKDLLYNAISHGMIYCYLVQPLTYNSNVPTTISFNVYISGGKDLEFSGYATDNLEVMLGDNPVYPGVPNFFGESKGTYEIVGDKHTGLIINANNNRATFQSEGEEKIESLVEVSSQSSILNNKVDVGENHNMAFRPNTSIRDYLRFMYPQATIRIPPDEPLVTKFINIVDLVHSYSHSDMFLALNSLYLGTSGGFKFKFKIIGATSASIYYLPPGTAYYGDGVFDIGPTRSTPPTDAPSLSNFEHGMGFLPSIKSYTSPQIEIQDYTRPYKGVSPGLESTPGNAFEVEFAIPNMNPNNYVGNAAKWRSGSYPDPENDYGVLMLNIVMSKDEVATSPCYIIPFIGFNDETRLGYQVYCPQKKIASYGADGKVLRDSMYRPLTYTVSPDGGFVLNPAPSFGAYYFKSV